MGYLLSSIKPQILAKLNDLEQQSFTDDVLLPHAISAANELQNELTLNGILAVESVSANLTVPQGTTDLASVLLLPIDLLEPQRIQERLAGSTDLFQPMDRREWIPEYQPTDSLRYWAWREENIWFLGATQDREIKIHYLKKRVAVYDWTSTIDLLNSEEFMVNRTAALASEFMGENKTRADSLNAIALIQIDRIIGIGVKSKQGARTRRRPYVLVGRRRWL